MQTSDDLVGLSTASGILTEQGDKISVSSLSRYIRQHSDALDPSRRGREVVVSLSALKRHRAENIRVGDAKPFAAVRSKADESKDKIRVDRQIRELDLAERQGAITLVSEVKDAAFSAVGALRSAFASALNDCAEDIASVAGIEPRLVRPHLRTLERKALDSFVRVLSDQIAAGLPFAAGDA